MKKLTRREKTLLYILAVIALVGGLVYFAILPQTQLRDVLDEAVGEREMELASMQSEIAMRAAVEADIAEARARIEEERGKFLPAMTNDDTDRYITGLLQQNGLVAESLTLTESSYTQSAASIGAVRVSCAARGDFEPFIRLMQQVHDTDGIRVADFTLRFGGYLDVLDEEATKKAADEAAAAAAAAAAKNKNKKKTEKTAEPALVMKQVPYYTTVISFEMLMYDETPAEAAAVQGAKE